MMSHVRSALALSLLLGLAGCADESAAVCVDTDGDGYGEGVACIASDCDDTDPNVHPGATETVGNGADESCDGAELCFVDMDGDGFRVATTLVSVDVDCADATEALASAAFDCDDASDVVHEGLTEIVGDGIDQDCDGTESCYANGDGDAYRTDAVVASADIDCTDLGEALGTLPSSDCDEALDTVFPGATEVVGDGIDQDCDTEEQCHVDADADGARTAALVASVDLDCADPGEAFPAAPLDCADLASADPNCGGANGDACSPLLAVDDCNGGIDNDCDTQIDEDVQLAWFADADEDGVGDTSAITTTCTQPTGSVAADGDCDDADPTVWAVHARFVDDDSDGSGAGVTVDACEGDGVALGFATVDGDCNDGEATTRVGAAELPDDGVDQDCVGGDLVMSDATGIFVSPTGNDGNPGTRAAPVATIFAGHQKASASQVLFIADGNYAYDNVVSELQRSMFGGYAPDFMTRGDGSGTVITFDGSVAIGAAPVALERLRLSVVDTANPSAVALSIVGGNVTLRDVTLRADGAFGSTAIAATSSTVVLESSDVSVGDASLCTSLSSRGGRLVVARSHIGSCAAESAGGSSIGVLVTRTFGTDEPGYGAVVGNVIETDPVGGLATSIAVALYGTRTRVLVANNTIHLGPSVGPFDPAQVGIDVSSTPTYGTVVVAINNLITAQDGASTAAGIDMGAPVGGSVALLHNDVFLNGVGDCIVMDDGACVSNTNAFDGSFGGCLASEGNFAADPQYTDAVRHVAAASACVDTGLGLTTRAPTGLVSTDFEGDARYLMWIDVGADEYAP